MIGKALLLVAMMGGIVISEMFQMVNVPSDSDTGWK